MIKSDYKDNRLFKCQTIYKLNKQKFNKNKLMERKFIKGYLSNNRPSF